MTMAGILKKGIGIVAGLAAVHGSLLLLFGGGPSSTKVGGGGTAEYAVFRLEPWPDPATIDGVLFLLGAVVGYWLATWLVDRWASS